MCPTRHRTTGYYDARKNFIACDELMLIWAKKEKKKIFTVHLQVMHLDNNPANNENSNLASGCPRCHLKRDRINNTALRLMSRNKYAKKP